MTCDGVQRSPTRAPITAWIHACCHSVTRAVTRTYPALRKARLTPPLQKVYVWLRWTTLLSCTASTRGPTAACSRVCASCLLSSINPVAAAIRRRFDRPGLHRPRLQRELGDGGAGYPGNVPRPAVRFADESPDAVARRI